MTKTFELTDEEQTMIYMALDYVINSYDNFMGVEETKQINLWRKFRPGAL